MALETFRAAPTRFDLVITDSTMPGMTGVMLAHELRLLRPDIPIILCSGSHESFDHKHTIVPGMAAVLPKPWSPQEFAHTIQRVHQPSQQ
jgi:CheY-like chemotaxis protein